jgi:thymidine phosphorylase
MQTRQIGVAANTLGAGRQKTDDAVDLGVGFIVHKKVGDRVEAGEPILTIHHRGGRGLAEAQRMLAAGITIGDAAVDRLPLIIETVGTAG